MSEQLRQETLEQERYEHEKPFIIDEIKQTTPMIYGAISDVMTMLSKVGIAKNSKNVQQGYRFRGIDDMYNALAPFLSTARLLILPRIRSREITERETKNGGMLFYVVLDVEFDFVSAIDGSKHVVRVFGEAMDSGDKATNKAMSAAYKYACMQAFCIPTEGDNDADAQTHEVKGKSDPRGEIESRAVVDEKQVDKYVNLFTDALNADVEEEKRAELVSALRAELAGKNDLFIAIGERLESKQKSAIRLYCEQHTKAMKANLGSTNGVRG